MSYRDRFEIAEYWDIEVSRCELAELVEDMLGEMDRIAREMRAFSPQSKATIQDRKLLLEWADSLEGPHDTQDQSTD